MRKTSWTKLVTPGSGWSDGVEKKFYAKAGRRSAPVPAVGYDKCVFNCVQFCSTAA